MQLLDDVLIDIGQSTKGVVIASAIIVTVITICLKLMAGSLTWS